MNKQTYIKLPNITVSDLQKVVDYLDENNIKYIEYFEEENKLEKALNEIEENYCNYYGADKEHNDNAILRRILKDS